MLNNRGHINLGISCDTAAFACDSFARYWSRHGRRAYVADAGHHRQAFFREALARMKQPPTGKQLEWTWAVDYYHAAERITTMAEAIFGAGREASAASGSIQSGLVANLWVHICPFSLRRQPKPHSGKLTNASIFPVEHRPFADPDAVGTGPPHDTFLLRVRAASQLAFDADDPAVRPPTAGATDLTGIPFYSSSQNSPHIL